VYEHYIGVDLHAAFFQVCSVTAAGDRVWETRFPRTEAGIGEFLARCLPTTAVAVEATGPTWHFVDAIHASVGAVQVIDPFRTRLKAGFAARNDRLDARRLADALRRDSVVGIYYPPPAIRECRELCRYRHTLVHTRSALVQRVRSLLLRQGIVDARRLTKVRDDAWLELLSLPPQAKASVEGLRRVLQVVRTECLAADEAVLAAAAADPVATALQKVVGIGPVLALTIRAEVGDIRRFQTAAWRAMRVWCRASRRVRAVSTVGGSHAGARRGYDGLWWKLRCMRIADKIEPVAGCGDSRFERER
jgi:transposase